MSRLKVLFLVLLFILGLSATGFCLENWSLLVEDDETLVQIDPNLINDVQFNGEKFKSVWVKASPKDNPGNFITMLVYVSSKKQVCIHQTKSYENARIKSIDGKENNPSAECLSVDPGKVAHYIYEYLVYHRHIADGQIAQTPPQQTKPTDTPATPPVVKNPTDPPRQPQPPTSASGSSTRTSKRGGGIFAK